MERLGWQDSEGCRFLDNFNFASLLAPVTFEEFRVSHFEQTPRRWHRHNPNFYDDLFSLKDFDRAVAAAPAYVKVAEAKKSRIAEIRQTTPQGWIRRLRICETGPRWFSTAYKRGIRNWAFFAGCWNKSWVTISKQTFI